MPPSLIFLYFVKTRHIANIKKPLANIIIIQPRYLDKDDCRLRKNDSEISEFKETIVVITAIRSMDNKNLGLLKLFIKLRNLKSSET